MVRFSIICIVFIVFNPARLTGQGYYDYIGGRMNSPIENQFLKWNRNTERFDSVWVNHFSGTGANVGFSIPFADCAGDLLYVSNPETGEVRNAQNGLMQNGSGFVIGHDPISFKVPNSGGDFLVFSKQIFPSQTAKLIVTRINPFYNFRQGRVVVPATVIDSTNHSRMSCVFPHADPDSLSLIYGRYVNLSVRTRLASASIHMGNFGLTLHHTIMGRSDTPYDFQQIIGHNADFSGILGSHYNIMSNGSLQGAYFLAQINTADKTFERLIHERIDTFPFRFFKDCFEINNKITCVQHHTSSIVDSNALFTLNTTPWDIDSIIASMQPLRRYYRIQSQGRYYGNQTLIHQRSIGADVNGVIHEYRIQPNGSIVYRDSIGVFWGNRNWTRTDLRQQVNPLLLNWTQADFVVSGTCLGDTTVLSVSDSDFLDYAHWELEDSSGSVVLLSGGQVRHLYPAAGSYRVRLFVQYCGLYPDTLEGEITIIAPPSSPTLPDTALCAGSDLPLAVPPQPGNSVLWSSGDSSWSSSFNSEDWHWVEISNACFSTRDSFYVTMHEPPQSGLPTDTNLCVGDVLLLTPAAGDYSWAWQDGSTVPLSVTESGTYALLMTNACGTFVHEVRAQFRTAPDFALRDTARCEGQFYRIELPDTWQGAYLWDDGSSERVRILTDSGWYSAQITNPCGIDSSSMYLSLIDCQCHMYLPNAFTPNDDGLNDELRIATRCPLSDYRMEVFDRWGRLIFVSLSLDEGWDGTFRGELLPSGAYPFVIHYTPEGRNARVEKGVVHLLR